MGGGGGGGGYMLSMLVGVGPNAFLLASRGLVQLEVSREHL